MSSELTNDEQKKERYLNYLRDIRARLDIIDRLSNISNMINSTIMVKELIMEIPDEIRDNFREKRLDNFVLVKTIHVERPLKASNRNIYVDTVKESMETGSWHDENTRMKVKCIHDTWEVDSSFSIEGKMVDNNTYGYYRTILYMYLHYGEQHIAGSK